MHIALPKGGAYAWVVQPPAEVTDAVEAVKAAKRRGLRAWMEPAVEYVAKGEDEAEG